MKEQFIITMFIYYIVLCSVSRNYTFENYNLDGNFLLFFFFNMLLSLLLLIPLIGIFVISTSMSYELSPLNIKRIKITALSTSVINLFFSLIIFILFDFSTNQFQFVQEYYQISSYDFYLGVDGLSIYFVLLTTIIMPIALLSN
jgi:NADH:ubiquinone oxidoreductase subunit 4 (subunit M)